jgi:hypothetical protein
LKNEFSVLVTIYFSSVISNSRGMGIYSAGLS